MIELNPREVNAMGDEQQCTVAGLMELVSEYGHCRWSEGSSGATYLDRVGERRSREEAADLYQQIKGYAEKLATSPVAADTMGDALPFDSRREALAAALMRFGGYDKHSARVIAGNLICDAPDAITEGKPDA